eukprot:CAMPEP_0201580420 /NCGR_PEP_ID=MMETSP0190_2-20130828/45924_1 /ASSEMBLY_ACC=CAM_ASM_000263 /TAXON_ID=37353 /ORGANISM="Rosalina sp." /LENGTH=118 /DNA_ID=CAMNT_0048016429 /DNA_START=67 /DNA_END=423 /DNA_ORIENTATION=+
MSVKNVFTCWTRFKGGKFKLDEKDNRWNEYNKKNKIVNSYKQLDSDDYALNPYEVILFDEKTEVIIKLDKTNSRKSKVPSDEPDFDITMMELFKLKWELLETGFWDSLDDEQETESEK